ncbi:MAG: hypothetical protein GEU68_14110 [Actinobacteria bacterium]|nr:hypothetical protein [Actinomycetota bacterium]
MSRTRLVLVATAAVVFMAACQGDEQRRVQEDRGDRGVEDATATDGELLARVSAAIRAGPGERRGFDVLAYTDLVAARELLGLPEGAGIPGPGKQRLLFSFASRPLFVFGTLFGRNPTLGVLGDVLDGGRIEAAASTNFAISGPGADQAYPRDVLVLRTRQPFDQIASRLRRWAGYEESADRLLVGGERADGVVVSAVRDVGRFPFPAVGDAGGGVVVFGGSAPAARAALRGRRG